ncbi:MAG: antiterminator LoaP [Clostridia bacterium]|nr:antiterminator LoaP [Clostridia bacterium]
MSSNRWYALFVVTGEEDNVKERLQFKFKDSIRILVPKRKLKERKDGKWEYVIRTLFPGYVLLHGDITIEHYYEMKGIPGLIKFLRSGSDLLEINYWEMEVIAQLICNDETIGFSDVLVENGKVIVVDGPLLSMEGYIVSLNKRKGRAKVRLDFLGEQRTVELGINMLQSAGE